LSLYKIVYFMRKILLIFLLSIVNSMSLAEELKNKLYNSASEQLSATIGNLIPGEGVTEVSIEITDEKDDDPDISILALRDIYSEKNSNFFTQFSLANTMVNGSDRYFGNLGFGYRKLSPNNNYMYGINTFYDKYFQQDHARIGAGLELKGSLLDISINKYNKVTNQTTYKETREQILSGLDYNITTQIPHMPWAKFNLEGYIHENEKKSSDTEGKIYSLEFDVSPGLQFNIGLDQGKDSGVEDVYEAELVFNYPPKENNKTMTGSGLSEEMFEEANMEAKLREKVRRNNRPVIEIQGAVVVTSK